MIHLLGPWAAVGCLAMLAVTAQAAGTFELQSTDVVEGGTLPSAQVYSGFGCKGGNVSPQLSWTGAPAQTRSYAISVFDPDAPGGGWWHWVVFDIPAEVRFVPRGAGAVDASPAGARQARNDFGERAYGGACPPPGDKPHRYVFTVHALGRARLDLPDDATAAQVGAAIEAQRIASASITARFGR